MGGRQLSGAGPEIRPRIFGSGKIRGVHLKTCRIKRLCRYAGRLISPLTNIVIFVRLSSNAAVARLAMRMAFDYCIEEITCKGASTTRGEKWVRRLASRPGS